MAATKFFGLTSAMSEQRFFPNQRLTTVTLPPPNSKRIGIQITWIEGVAMTIKIQCGHIEAGRKICGTRFRPGVGKGRVPWFESKVPMVVGSAGRRAI